jgi:hypothetical protein
MGEITGFRMMPVLSRVIDRPQQVGRKEPLPLDIDTNLPALHGRMPVRECSAILATLQVT